MTEPALDANFPQRSHLSAFTCSAVLSQQHLPACLQKMPLLICSNGVANWVIQKVLPAAGTQHCRAQPALQARTPQHRGISVLPAQLPVPPTASLCHPKELWPILLPHPWLQESLTCREVLLCLLGLTFPCPGREYCLQDCVCFSLPLRLSQFPTCTAPLLGRIFLDCSGHSSSSAVIFGMFGSGSAQKTQGLVITWILHTG